MSAGAGARELAGNRILVWLACVLGGAAIHLALWQVSEPSTLFSDFYKAYYPAAEQIWENGTNANLPVTEEKAGGFVNIPIIAWLFSPLIPLGEDESGWAFLAVGVAAALTAWVLLVRTAQPGRECAAPLLFLCLVNGPMVNSLREGNTTHIVLLLVAAAYLVWRAGWDYFAGFLLGACALVKLPLLLFGAYFFLRGKWRVVLGGLTTIAIAVLLSLADYGLQGNVTWFTDSVEPFLGHVVPAFNVQSIDGFLMRLYTGEALLHNWDPLEPALAHKLTRYVIFAAIYGGAIWFGWRTHQAGPQPAVNGTLSDRDTLEFALVITLALISSPISWTHYYLLLLVPYALYLGGRLVVPDDRTSHWLIWSSLVLTSLPVIVPQQSLGWIGEVLARTVVSAWLFGGLMLLAALMRALWMMAPLQDIPRTAAPELR
jgi:hypothetical protein